MLFCGQQHRFVIVDDYTFRVDFLRRDKLTFPDLFVPTAGIISSALAKRHATDKDPRAMEWLKNNEAGGGAYQIEKWIPGQELTYRGFAQFAAVCPSGAYRRNSGHRCDLSVSIVKRRRRPGGIGHRRYSFRSPLPREAPDVVVAAIKKLGGS